MHKSTNQRRPWSRSWPRALVAAICLTATLCISASVWIALPRRDGGYAPDPQTSPGISRLALGQGQSDAVIALSTSTLHLLQFPVGSKQTVWHVSDSQRHEEYDEVDELDARGEVVAVAMFTGARLRAAIRFDDPPQPAKPIDKAEAIASAQAAATKLKLGSGAPSSAYEEVPDSGWDVNWERRANGVPVRGDGVLIRVWADGRIASVAQNLHALAAAPAEVVDASVATSRVSDYVAGMAAEVRAGVNILPPELQWVRPNGAFDTTKPYDEEPVCRLAWVVTVEGSPDGAFTRLAYFIDAADGSLLGGDVVE